MVEASKLRSCQHRVQGSLTECKTISILVGQESVLLTVCIMDFVGENNLACLTMFLCPRLHSQHGVINFDNINFGEAETKSNF